MPSAYDAALAAFDAAPADLTLAGVKALVDYSVPYRKGMGPDGPWREITYQVKWDESDAFIDMLLPGTLYVGTPPSGTLVYKLPHAYPGNAALWCLEADGELVGPERPDGAVGAGKLVAGAFCRIRCMYRRPPFDVAGTESNSGPIARPFCRWRSRTLTETIQLPESSLKEGPAGPNLSKKFAYEYPMTEYTVTFSNMPYFPNPELLALAGSLNSVASTPLGADVGQLRFMGIEAEDEYNAAGNVVWTWNATILQKPFDFNSVRSSEDGEGWVIAQDSSNVTPYPYTDFLSQLFFAVSTTPAA
jgi:hypothetical protein